MTEPRYILHLAPTPADKDKFGRLPAARLKQALKILGRQLGLKCVRVETGPPSTDEGTTEDVAGGVKAGGLE